MSQLGEGKIFFEIWRTAAVVVTIYLEKMDAPLVSADCKKSDVNDTLGRQAATLVWTVVAYKKQLLTVWNVWRFETMLSDKNSASMYDPKNLGCDTEFCG